MPCGLLTARQQTNAQPVLRQLPLSRGAGVEKDALRRWGGLEHGIVVLLAILYGAIRIRLGLFEPMAALRDRADPLSCIAIESS